MLPRARQRLGECSMSIKLDCTHALPVPQPLGEGPVWRLGKVMLLPRAHNSGLQLPSTSGVPLGLASVPFPLYPTYSLASAEDLSWAIC